MNPFDLSGQVALVTGTSGGLGQGMAIGLAEAGADVVLVSYSKPAETASAIEALGRKAYVIEADLSREDELSAVFEKALAFQGRIDILVNNAGIIRRTPAADHAGQDWHDVIGLNLNTVFFLSQLAGRHMIERGSGKIINIASMLSYQGGINVPGYTASKHGVAGLTKHSPMNGQVKEFRLTVSHLVIWKPIILLRSVRTRIVTGILQPVFLRGVGEHLKI